MTQEEKDLLLKDLCARLPQLENWVQYDGKDYVVTGYGHGRVSLLSSRFSSAVGPCPLVEEVKPYLRPMSSMTEKKRMSIFFGRTMTIDIVETSQEVIDYCNSHHLDYRGLIEKGLALEAPEDMYKEE